MNRLERGIKKLQLKLNDQAFELGLKKLPKQTSGRRILVYHGVCKDAKTDINARFISTALFEKQISYFKEHFQLISLDQYFEGEDHPDKMSLAITFDDGYFNNLREALPILEKYQVPATFFITTIRQAGYEYLWADLLDLYRYTGPSTFTFKGQTYSKGKHEYTSADGSLKRRMKTAGWQIKKEFCDQILADNAFLNRADLRPYFQLMNEEEIKGLSQSDYASVGAHGLYHNCLTEIPIEEAKIELEQSKKYLEYITQKEVKYLAYPDGAYNPKLVELAHEIGYPHQLLVDYSKPAHQSDSRLAERFGINPYIGFENQIQCILNGSY